MKKRLFALPLMAIAALCVVLLGACGGGPSVEELIRQELTEEFDSLTPDDQEFLDAMENGAGDAFDQLGIDPKEFAKAYLDGFSYEIGDILVDEDAGTADANVTVTVKPLSTIMDQFQSKFMEQLADADSSLAENQEELYKMAGTTLLEVTKDTEPTEAECVFTYTRDDDGDWVPEESAAEELTNAMS